jgi:hypothetical protein
LTEALYADSATKDIKFVDPEIISQVRILENRVDKIKRGMGPLSKDTELNRQIASFVEKWRQE